jgi:hypothetical protein
MMENCLLRFNRRGELFNVVEMAFFYTFNRIFAHFSASCRPASRLVRQVSLEWATIMCKINPIPEADRDNRH